MLFHFCPQCGTKLQPGFRFCPSCGDKLQCVVDPSGPVEAASSGVSLLHVTDGVTMTANASSPTPSTGQLTGWDTEGLVCATPSSVSTRPPLRRTRNSVPVARNDETPSSIASPPVTASPTRTTDQSHKSVMSPRKRRAVTPKVEQIKNEPSVELASSLGSSPLPRSPSTAKGKAKKAKRACAVEPLQEGEELCDTTGRKWRLVKLLSQSDAEMFYGVRQNGPGANSSDCKHILKLGAKDGKMFNEQNFLQRAAKPSSVDKWIKHAKMDFLGIPTCVGFGLHADSYRLFSTTARKWYRSAKSRSKSLNSFYHQAIRLLNS